MTPPNTDPLHPQPADATAFEASTFQAPLVIGITGHRDLRDQDREPLKVAVKTIFLELKGQCGSTPQVFLSSLAEGADRLAAEVFLSLADDFQGKLFAVLPMPRAAYELDFEGQSLTDFRTLLSKSEGVLELPLVPGVVYEAIMKKGTERDLQYESAGKVIVQKSQILIALWDGWETGLVGGTSAVVKFQTEGLPVLGAYSIEAPEGFPVYHVMTPRVKNPTPVGEPFQRRVLYPDSFKGDADKAKKYYDQMFARIDEFNRYAAEADVKLCEEARLSKAYMLKDLREQQLSPELRLELNRYSLTDALALRFQKVKVRADRCLHAIIFLAFLSFVFFAHFSPHPMFLLISFVLVVVGWAWRRQLKKTHGDTKSEDYRAMAEALRVRFFWRMVDLPDSVADHYLGKQRSELDWIRNGFRGWDVHGESKKNVWNQDRSSQLKLLLKLWVQDQVQWFGNTKRRNEDRLKRLEFWGGKFVWIALGGGALLLVGAELCRYRPQLAESMHAEIWRDTTLIVVEAALAGAALLHNYANTMVYREHVKQYERMEGVFDHAGKLIDAKLHDSDLNGALQLIKRLGQESLAENGDWVLLHRERPLDVPHP